MNLCPPMMIAPSCHRRQFNLHKVTSLSQFDVTHKLTHIISKLIGIFLNSPIYVLIESIFGKAYGDQIKCKQNDDEIIEDQVIPVSSSVPPINNQLYTQ